MDTPIKYHEQELSYAGIDLKALLASGKKVRACVFCMCVLGRGGWQLHLQRARCKRPLNGCVAGLAGGASNSADLTLLKHTLSSPRTLYGCRLLLTLLQLVISEWGVGGGTQDGNGIAPDLDFVAGRPFFGLWYPYR